MSADSQLVDEIARRVVDKLTELSDPTSIIVGVSNRHVHLSAEDLKTLFGLDEMTVKRYVRQPKEFAADHVVTVHGPKRSFTGVRVMGPCRAKSQVELSRTDCFALGLNAPVTQSGHLENAAPIEIEGPLGRISCEHAAIIAARHLHTGPEGAAQLGVKDQDLVKIRVDGERGGVLDNVIVRVKADWIPEVHLDTDEANGLGLRSGDRVHLVKE